MLGFWPKSTLQPVKDACAQWTKKLKASYHECNTSDKAQVNIHVSNTGNAKTATAVKTG